MRRFDKHIPIFSGLGDWARLRLILAHLSAHRDSEAFQALMVFRVSPAQSVPVR